MKGNITRRGADTWRLRFDVGRDANGKRRMQSVTVRAKNKREAQAKLTDILSARNQGTYVEPTKITVADYVRARLAQWQASGTISAKTAERYSELIENQIVPHLGHLKVQALKPIDVEAWHSTLRTSGGKRGGAISARTIGHAHRVLSKALREAVKFDLTLRNAAGKDGQTAPKVDKVEVEIIPPEKIPDMLAKLRGRAIYPKGVTALFTGLRRGELLALRWPNVDLDGKELDVREALEETREHGVRFKATKTTSGRRRISMPDIVVETLREHRRQQLEQRMAMGLGKMPDDALVFPALDGGPQAPRQLSGDWREVRKAAGVGEVTWHALRHTHASQLIDAGVDIVTISKRLGHASPNITLQVYAHLFQQRDDKAATAINLALANLGGAQ